MNAGPSPTSPRPIAAWVAALGLLIGMPLIDAAGAGMLHWALGDSAVAMRIAPYVATLRLLHAVTAVLLAVLLLTVRNPAAPGITIVALWLEYPPLIQFFNGIFLLADTQGRVSWPPGNGVAISCLGPAAVTLYLLALPRLRRFYRIGRTPVDAPDSRA